ncbi:hypothetical protein [Natronolimnobius baerhuensis]|uniref:YokE-like PH domain-containing protein n=1 Tax=Natronolimnobius baerhuensis TaxID=253108 RepID=A0A202E7X8_9EURY|nr:hypothetical protein [Natronolimnobius baerhuensis]OVE84314.1 hypothetical protein B2G88_07815 [Natronolimnobius baerhuensis]
MTLQDELTKIQPFIEDDETSIDAYSSDVETGILTDRRLIRFKTLGRNEDKTQVTSTYFNQVCETRVEHKTTPDFDQDSLIYGVIALFIALVSIALTGQFEGDASAVLILVGIGVGVMGIILLLEAYNTPAGSVTVHLKTADGEVAVSVILPEDHLEFAQTLSKTVSNAHTPSSRVTQTVG